VLVARPSCNVAVTGPPALGVTTRFVSAWDVPECPVTMMSSLRSDAAAPIDWEAVVRVPPDPVD